MRAVLQRVSSASVRVDGDVTGEISSGLLVLLGSGSGDNENDSAWIASKIAHLRIFEDDDGKMNLSVSDIGGSILLVSQFTLYGDCRKGRRPGFGAAMEPERAKELVDETAAQLESLGLHVEHGVFGADMKVELVNDGPVTMLLDSERQF